MCGRSGVRFAGPGWCGVPGRRFRRMGPSIVPERLPAAPVSGENWLQVVERQIEALKFGSVEITVHEGRVVQIETSVKVRFDKPN